MRNFRRGRASSFFKVAEKTEQFLTTHFTAGVSNQIRRQWRDKYGAPNASTTACPCMDKVIKGRLSVVAKSRDRQLAKQQVLMLDAVGPITYILDEAAKGKLSQKTVMEAAQTGLKLLWQRRLALQSMNPALTDMADDDFLYRAAASSLFGEGFSKKAKRCLNQATSSSRPTSIPGQYRGGDFFLRGRSYRNGPQEWPTWDRPRTQRAEGRVPQEPPIPSTQEASRPKEKLGLIKGSDLPIVTLILINKNYLPHLIQSPIIQSLAQMGIQNMAQRVIPA